MADREAGTAAGIEGLRHTAVVTGASEGIGLEIARLLAAEGHQLLLVARDAVRLEAAAAGIRDGLGAEVMVLALDLTSQDAAQQIEATLAAAGAVADLIVNNAGVGLSGELANQSPEEIEALLTLNVVAMTRLIRHSLPSMKRRGRGGFLNIASLAGYVPGPYQAAYYASKAYVISLSEALARELKPYGIRVTVAVPGPVETRFHDKMGAGSAIYRRFVPAARPRTVARLALLGHRLGLVVVVPGVLLLLVFVALRILPHRLLVPIVGWLLRPRAVGGG